MQLSTTDRTFHHSAVSMSCLRSAPQTLKCLALVWVSLMTS
jgi:hypothetical protein